MLLESSVVRVLLSVAAAADECSCARDCLATRHENTLYPPGRIFLTVVSWCDLSFICRIFVSRSVACNTVVVAECSLLSVQCVPVSRGLLIILLVLLLLPLLLLHTIAL